MKPVLLFILAMLFPSVASAQHAQTKAEKLFADYQGLADAYDPALADLYCDTAVIRNTRTYPTGQQRKLEIPASQYKALVRSAMPLAKARGDTNRYSNVAYQLEGANVRITATRYSALKHYDSPISLLVGACNGTAWAVLEEISASRP